jgi:hypothetical protein
VAISDALWLTRRMHGLRCLRYHREWRNCVSARPYVFRSRLEFEADAKSDAQAHESMNGLKPLGDHAHRASGRCIFPLMPSRHLPDDSGSSPHPDFPTELARNLPRTVGWIALVWHRVAVRYSNWRHRRKIENLVQLRPLEIRVEIAAADKGKIHFGFAVSNFGRVQIDAERVELYGVQVGSRALEATSEMLRVSGCIPPRTVGLVVFAVDLSPADIRNVVEGVDVAPNTRSSPRADVYVHAGIVFSTPKRPFTWSFDFTTGAVKVRIPDALL